ncbi:MAG: hypothetical protein J0H43_01160, partial [Actinobacteria bacterium]|nr:hypothetical protein [Actinomycetota bacterium]
ESPATEDETRAHLLTRGNRSAAPILKSFVQDQDRRKKNRAGPLSVFVRNCDDRALKAFLFLHVFISNGKDGWSSTLPLQTWARVFGTTRDAERRSASSAATKLLTRLEQRHLISRARSGRARQITVTLLKPDGSGADYGNRPLGATADDRFFNLTHRFWTDDWHRQLDLPAVAMLLVALCEPLTGFELATERVPEWYGWSADTAERGLKTLHDHGLINVHKRVQKAPLAPLGVTIRNVYTLTGALVPDPTRKPPARKTTKSTRSTKSTTTGTTTRTKTEASKRPAARATDMVRT